MRGFFVGAGFNSVGIASAGGAGRALAEWVVEGEPTSDLVAVDIRRFAPFHANDRWLRERVVEMLGPALRRAVAEPRAGDRAGRSAARRCTTGSPAHGAVLRLARWAGSGPTSSPPPGRTPSLDYTWGKPRWLPWSAAEQRATRDGGRGLRPDVVLEVRRRRAATPRRAAVDLHRTTSRSRSGRSSTPALLNRRGTYESDLTVTRVADDGVPAGQQLGHHRARPRLAPPARPGRPRHPGRRRDLGVRRARGDGTALAGAARGGVRGDAARRLPASRPRGCCGSAARTVRATRITYVGELGWELYVADRDRARRVRRPDGRRRGPRRASTRATTRSSRCGWRRATAPSAASSRPTTRRSRPGCCSPASCAPTWTSSAGPPSRRPARAGPGAGWSRSSSTTPSRCCGAASWCCATASPVGQVTSAAWGETVGACVGLAYVADPAGVTSRDWVDVGHLRGERRRLGAPGHGRSAGAVRPGQRAGPRLTRGQVVNPAWTWSWWVGSLNHCGAAPEQVPARRRCRSPRRPAACM